MPTFGDFYRFNEESVSAQTDYEESRYAYSPSPAFPRWVSEYKIFNEQGAPFHSFGFEPFPANFSAYYARTEFRNIFTGDSTLPGYSPSPGLDLYLNVKVELFYDEERTEHPLFRQEFTIHWNYPEVMWTGFGHGFFPVQTIKYKNPLCEVTNQTTIIDGHIVDLNDIAAWYAYHEFRNPSSPKVTGPGLSAYRVSGTSRQDLDAGYGIDSEGYSTSNPFEQVGFESLDYALRYPSGALLRTTFEYSSNYPISDIPINDGLRQYVINWGDFQVLLAPCMLTKTFQTQPSYWHQPPVYPKFSAPIEETLGAQVLADGLVTAVYEGARWIDDVFEPSGVRVRRFEYNNPSGEEISLLPALRNPSLASTHDGPLFLFAQNRSTRAWELYQSGDRGETWGEDGEPVAIASPFGLEFRLCSICALPSGQIIAVGSRYRGTTSGSNSDSESWFSMWDGSQWQPLIRIGDITDYYHPSSSGLSYEKCAVYVNFFADQSRIYVSNGVDAFWYSDNMGDSWVLRATTGLPFPESPNGVIFENINFAALESGGAAICGISRSGVNNSNVVAPELFFSRTWGESFTEINNWQSRSIVANVSDTFYRNFVAVEWSGAESSQMMLTNGVDKHFVSDDLGESWKPLI